MTRQWDQIATLKHSRQELSHCGSNELSGSALKRPYVRTHIHSGT